MTNSERTEIRNPVRQSGIAAINALPFGAEFVGRSVTTPNLWKGLGLGLAHGGASAFLLGADLLLSYHGASQLAAGHELQITEVFAMTMGSIIGLGGVLYGGVAAEEVVQGMILGIGDGLVKTTGRYIPGANNVEGDSAYGPVFLPKKEREERKVVGGSFTLRRSKNPIGDTAEFPSIFFTDKGEITV